MDIWQILMTPFSLLLRFLCVLFNNYGVALILFTLFIKVILFPLSIKGKRSMIKSSILSGQVQEIQKKYGNNKEKANEEIQKLYTESGTSMFGGCGWSFLPLLILMPLYAIIRRPFKYMMMMKEETTIAVAKALGWADFTPLGTNELLLAPRLNAGNLESTAAAAGATTTGLFGMFVINFNFLGIDLSKVPSLMFWKSELFTSGDIWGAVGLFLLPVVSAVLSFVSYKVSLKTNQMSQNQPENKQQNNWMMILMGPVMSLWIGYSLPAGMCIYWIANSALGMVQEIIAGKMLKDDYEAAQKAMEEQQRKAKEAEKERRRKSAEKKAAAIAAGKKQSKKEKSAAEDVGGSSQIGLRRFARGRAYDPARYPATPYHDPNGPAKPKEEDQPLSDEEKALLAESNPELAAAAEQAEQQAAETAAAEEAAQEKVEEAPAPEDEEH